MFAIVKNNEIVKMGELKKLFPNISFPVVGPGSKWLADNNVVEVVYKVQKDQRFYLITEQPATYNESTKKVEIGYTCTAKLLDDSEETDDNGNTLQVKGLKSNWIAQVKQTANSILQSTDWMVIRKFERDTDIPASTATFRAAVITEATRLEAAIAAAETVEALITVVSSQQWPDK